MRQRSSLTQWMAVGVIALVAGCGDSPRYAADQGDSPEPLRPFESEAEFDAYMQDLLVNANDWADEHPVQGVLGTGGSISLVGHVGVEFQHGVSGPWDWGGRKASAQVHDRFLLAVRGGVLHVVDTVDPTQMRLAHAVQVSVLSPGTHPDLGQCRLLVQGNTVVVVTWAEVSIEGAPSTGFEVNHFTLGDEGVLSRGKTLYVQTNQRSLVPWVADGRLMLHSTASPFIARDVAGPYELHIPRLYVWDDGFTRSTTQFDWRSTTRPTTRPSLPLFQTFFACELDDPDATDCDAHTLITDGPRLIYVARRDVYVASEGQVLRYIPSSAAVSAHAVPGFPRHLRQFDDQLSVLVTPGLSPPPGLGGLGGLSPLDPLPESEDFRLDLVWISLDDFDHRGRQATEPTTVIDGVSTVDQLSSLRLPSSYRSFDTLVRLDGPVFSERRSLYALNLASGVARVVEDTDAPSSTTMPTAIGAERVARVGAEVHVANLAAEEPRFRRVLDLEFTPSVTSRFHPGAAGGVIANMVVAPSQDGWYGDGIVNLAFVQVSDAGTIRPAGAVSSSEPLNSGCRGRCLAAYYHNTYLETVGERSFVLLGREIVEVDIEAGAREIGQRLVLDAQPED